MTNHDAKISVDRKQNLGEVCSNICQGYRRFECECRRAKNAGVKLVVLIEHGGRIKKIEDVSKWNNPRLKTSPYAISGLRMQYIMMRLASQYGIEWQFCSKNQTGKRIVEILSRE